MYLRIYDRHKKTMHTRTSQKTFPTVSYGILRHKALDFMYYIMYISPTRYKLELGFIPQLEHHQRDDQ